MADILDKADEASDAFFRAAISRKRAEGPKPNSFCHACDAALTNGTDRFCDAGCRDDYEHEQSRLDA